ncbi:protein-tyrosine phosphatase [Burkholderia diffusa]|uniref:Protein-tyrosine phosphatase n=2 Tax=Burkholderia diffusa TaxID=488732 RepID=A0A6P2PZF9_9BURK|nr:MULTISPECIES: tyrosine-protein phosphatase [Burkholderia]AOI98229.1 protein tyrosine phosphatase [Burkholderia sp. LA-2-3-30-S1-D2]KAB0655761.1 tyrosine-protein phosphatase [Burkholderia diffusa]KVE09538.1 protein tyrosine phosphatase [Burkholderia sp. LA-2-3-30-S1-D2]MBM2656191.1 tyrosine-protein phosphatase [Burkholderia diffusa]VWC12679.1 protein-tyrosine phosphatase [Burkholderia diffusa]
MTQKNDISRRHFLRLGAGTIGIMLGDAYLLSACGGDSIAVAPVTTPRLTSAANFRDTGGPDGTGYASASGSAMKKGVIYRSSALALSAADLATVDTLGITHVYDLRTTAEIHAQPDVPLAGATWQNLNVLGAASIGPLPTDGATATAFMQSMYRAFVTSETARTSFHTLFAGFAASGGNLVFHCTAGKDRTGWATAILHTILGVPRQTILADYLLTNIYSASEIAAYVAQARKSGGQDAADMMAALQGAQAAYMQAAFDQVVASYGSMASYIDNGLQLDQTTQNAIRQSMLV